MSRAASQLTMINFEMKRIMKTTMNQTIINRIATVWLAFAAVTAGAATTSVQRFWEFPTSANPAVSVSGGGRAVLAPGDFASGWIESDGMFGGATGVWDLGLRGTITMSDSNLLSAGVGQRREITVRVSQWLDGGIYAEFAQVAVPGAELATFDGSLTRLGTIGGWVEDQTVWVASAGTPTETVVVTGAASGTLVDDVSVEVTTVIVDVVPVLVIRRLAGGVNQVELSWSSAATDWVLQANDSVTDAAGWQAIEAPVSVAGERHSAVLDATGMARFFRLSKP